jgi:signal transduction histidine kinase
LTGRRRALVGLAGFGAALAVLLAATNVLHPLELATVDARFAVRGDDRDTTRDLLIVAIDQRTDARLAPNGQFPIPRRYYAQALHRLREDGARLTAIDVEFTSPTDVNDDDDLIDGLRASPGTILSATATQGHGATDTLGGTDAQRYARVRVASALLPLASAGTYRRFDIYEGGLATIPVAVATALQPSFTTSELGRAPVWIDYAGGPGTVSTVSLLDLLRGRVPPSEVRGRVVLIGVSDPAAQDLHSYSALTGARMAGVEIEANAVATALAHAPLRGASGWVAMLLTLAVAMAPALAVLGRRPWLAAGLLAVALLAFLGLAQLLFGAGVIVPVANPLVAFLITGGAALLTSFVLELRERTEQVKSARTSAIAAADSARERVERDLHDGVQQRLLALAMGLSAPNAARDPELLPNSAEQVKLALAEIRELARGAYPAVLREAGLAAALQSLADHAPVPVTVLASDLDGLSEERQRTAYFVAAEGLANAIKHADAAHVTITARTRPTGLTVLVADDGRGGADPGGSGLTGLAERAAAAGGTLSITSRPGAGTQLELRMP